MYFPYFTKTTFSYYITKGKIAFDDCIRFLSTQKSIEPLELNNDLKIELTIDNELEKNIVSYEFIEKILKKKFEELKDKYIILGFHYDICSNNTEISAILQIVDDTKNKVNEYDDSIKKRTDEIKNELDNYLNINYTFEKFDDFYWDIRLRTSKYTEQIQNFRNSVYFLN